MASTSDKSQQSSIVENRRVRLERLLQIASRDFDLRFEFGSRDRVGNRHIAMKTGPLDVVSSQLVNLKGRALNLLGHQLSEGWTWYEAALKQEAQGNRWFAPLWHALEDARVDNWFIKRWPGTVKYFDSNLPPDIGSALIRRLPISDQVVHGIYLEGRGYRGAHFPYKVRVALGQVADEINRGAHGKSAQDAYSAMLAIYPVVASLLLLDDQEMSQRHSQESETASPTGDQAKEKSEKRPGETVPEFEESDQVYSVSLASQRREFLGWFRPGSAPWFERGLGVKEIHPSALKPARQTIVEPPQGDLELYKQIRVEVQREVGYLAHRLTNLLREEVYLRYAGYYRTGRLNKAKLWKQRIGNYRLFQRLVTGISQVAAFTLLVDESASMKGQDKYKMAMKAALLLGETLDFVRVPLEIIGYTTKDYEAHQAMKLGLTPASEYRTTRCSPLEHRIYKRYDEPYYIARTRLTGIEPRHNNWDEEHLMFAFKRLQARPEKRKIIIIISDGQPNGDANYLIDTVKRIESTGCSITGVGIGAEFVREVYSNAIVVEDFRQMANELFQVLAREFRASAI